MRLNALTALAAVLSLASNTFSQTVTLTGSNTAAVTSTGADYQTSGATYATADGTSTLATTVDYRTEYGTTTDLSSYIASLNASSTASDTGNKTSSTSSSTQTLLVGSARTTTAVNGTASRNSTATSTAATPTNTVPCNGYPEFCTRKYSNITMVAAHNSPFVRVGNAASNQALDVTTQLNDGIRMLQFQAHLENGTMYLCHTSCELLNAGTLEAYLTTVVKWLRQNPADVVTILIGNYDYVDPGNFTAPVVNSGLIDYVYTTPELPMPLEKWPTLGEMILTQQRAVVMLDYQANQTALPWLLDEFSQMWETPFSPTDRAFPCTPQRPPNRPREVREDRMYMANHNLNVDIAIAGISLDVPATTILNETNAVSGYGSLGLTAQNCTSEWNRPPNFLLVDYYNLGNFNGSVFQVAATANNVTYNRNSCCGTTTRSAGVSLRPMTAMPLFSMFMVYIVFFA